MGEKRKSTYDATLYRLCVKIIKNIEEYEGTPVYQMVKNLKDNPIGIPETERGNTNVYAISLHNQLKVFFEIVQGKGESKIKKNYPKGYEVKPRWDATVFCDDDLIEAINVICKVNFTKELYMPVNHVNELSIKTHSQTRKHLYEINVERSDAILNFLVEKLYMESADEVKNQNNKELYEKLDESYELYRRALLKRAPRDNIHEYYHGQLFGGNKMEELKEIEEQYPQISCLGKYYYTWLYVDLSCHYIMQYVNNCIGNIWINFDEGIKCLNDEVDRLIQVTLADTSKANSSIGIYEYLFRMFSFYKFRDRFLGNIKAIKIIKEICGSRENPKEGYSLFELTTDTEKYTKKEIMDLFAEDAEVDRVTFDSHFQKIKKAIPMYNYVSGRNLPCGSVVAKAIYREIYLDKTKYKRKTCQRMFNEFLKTGKLEKSEYYFINEKINMGLWREYGYIDEYYKKNEFQENFYYLVCLILANIEPEIIRKKFEEVVISLENTIDVMLKKQLF